MIQRICPICDHQLGLGNYCKFCKQIVKNPYTQDVTYYLNERHGARDDNCEYHNPQLELPVDDGYRAQAAEKTAQWAMDAAKSMGRTASSMTRNGRMNARQNQESYHKTVTSHDTETAQKKAKKNINFVQLIVIFIILVNIIIPVITSFFRMFFDFFME